MTLLQYLGLTIIVSIFAGLFYATARVVGRLAALGIWGGAAVMTALLVLGVFLFVGGVK